MPDVMTSGDILHFTIHNGSLRMVCYIVNYEQIGCVVIDTFS